MTKKNNTSINSTHQIISCHVVPLLVMAQNVSEQALLEKSKSALAVKLKAMQTQLSYALNQVTLARQALEG